MNTLQTSINTSAKNIVVLLNKDTDSLSLLMQTDIWLRFLKSANTESYFVSLNRVSDELQKSLKLGDSFSEILTPQSFDISNTDIKSQLITKVIIPTKSKNSYRMMLQKADNHSQNDQLRANVFQKLSKILTITCPTSCSKKSLKKQLLNTLFTPFLLSEVGQPSNLQEYHRKLHHQRLTKTAAQLFQLTSQLDQLATIIPFKNIQIFATPQDMKLIAKLIALTSLESVKSIHICLNDNDLQQIRESAKKHSDTRHLHVRKKSLNINHFNPTLFQQEIHYLLSYLKRTNSYLSSILISPRLPQIEVNNFDLLIKKWNDDIRVFMNQSCNLMTANRTRQVYIKLITHSKIWNGLFYKSTVEGISPQQIQKFIHQTQYIIISLLGSLLPHHLPSEFNNLPLNIDNLEKTFQSMLKY